MRLIFGEDPYFMTHIGSYQNSHLSIMWFVENIDGIFAEFKTRGSELYDTLRTHDYGLREFSFMDINRYLIRVAEGAEE
ncbi:MAG TPA: hypothetical protein VGI43_03560 [Mucilaginibacter sp.]